MYTKTFKLTDLKVYHGNPRSISELAVDKVKKSIMDYGYNVPIVLDENNEIIAGHTRHAALLLIHAETGQYEYIDCLVADHLSPSQVKAYRIVDNQVANLTEWDFTKLRIELGGMDDFNYMDFGLIPDFTLTESPLPEIQNTLLEEDLPEVTTVKLSFGTTRIEMSEADYVNWQNYALSRSSSVEQFIRDQLHLDPADRDYEEIET